MAFHDTMKSLGDAEERSNDSSKPINGYDEEKKSFTGQPSNSQLMNEQLKKIEDKLIWGDDQQKAAFIKEPHPLTKIPIPLGDRVLVTKTKPEEKSAGGIIIPQMAIEDAKTGYVVATGPQVGKTKDGDVAKFTNAHISGGERLNYFADAALSVGDHVQYGEYAGTEVTHDGVTYLLMREPDILCILP